MSTYPVTLAATVHDPLGHTVPAIARLSGALAEVFAGIALNISDATHPDVTAAIDQHLPARVMTHAAGETIIGRARRDAVALAPDDMPTLHSDFDHVLRWVEHGRADLEQILADRPELDMLVIGRSPTAMSAEPRRLRETEHLVNHTHALLTGECWDLMFAIRRLSPRAARLVVEEGQVDTLANDVEWPMLARRAGLAIGYAESDALFYRTIAEFGAPADTGDENPLEWIRRLEFAAGHVAVLRDYLDLAGPTPG